LLTGEVLSFGFDYEKCDDCELLHFNRIFLPVGAGHFQGRKHRSKGMNNELFSKDFTEPIHFSRMPGDCI